MGLSGGVLAVLGLAVLFIFTKSKGGFMGTSVMRNEFIAILKEQKGKPYKIPGAVAPYSFDCASLGQYAYKLLGINIDRCVTEQSAKAPNLRKFNPYVILKDVVHLLKPGDSIGLDFDPKDALNRFNHVIYYIGNGKVIQATGDGQCPYSPNSRCKVVEDPLSRFTGATVRSIYSYFPSS